MDAIPHYPSFDYEADKPTAGVRWERWVNRLENLFIAMDLDETDDDNRRRALLLHYAGERVHDIYEVEKGDTGNTYKDVKDVLTNYFKPKCNIQLEIYNFRKCVQLEGQSLDEYVTELRRLAQTCKFTDVDGEILSQLIQHCTSNRLRRRALREPDKDLKDILEVGRSLEISDTQAATMEKETVHAVKNNKPPWKPKQQRWQQRSQQRPQQRPQQHQQNQRPQHQQQQRPQQQHVTHQQQKKCIFCGGTYPHKGTCPAMGQTCHYCKKLNHFKEACLKLKRRQDRECVHRVNETETEATLT